MTTVSNDHPIFDRMKKFEEKLLQKLHRATQIKNLVETTRGSAAVFKTTIESLKVIKLLGDHFGMPSHSREELHQTIRYFSDVKSGIDLLGVLSGTLEIIIKDVMGIATTVLHLKKGVPAKSEHRAPGAFRSDPKVVIEHTTFAEKIADLFVRLTRLVSSLSYAVAFGAFKPILFAEKHFKTKVSQSAKEVAEKFGLVVFILHISSFVGAWFELIRDSLYYHRMQSEDKLTIDMINQFFSDLALRIETMVEKVLELIPLGLHLFYDQIHKVSDFVKFLLALCTLVASVIGLVRLWNDSAVSY